MNLTILFEARLPTLLRLLRRLSIRLHLASVFKIRSGLVGFSLESGLSYDHVDLIGEIFRTFQHIQSDCSYNKKSLGCLLTISHRRQLISSTRQLYNSYGHHHNSFRTKSLRASAVLSLLPLTWKQRSDRHLRDIVS